jgi:hypothetical protein
MPTRRGKPSSRLGDPALVRAVHEELRRRRRDPLDGVGQVPVEVLENVARQVHLNGGAPLPADEVLKLMLQGPPSGGRDLWFAPAEFWSAAHRVGRAERFMPVIRPTDMACARWDLWIGALTTRPGIRWAPAEWSRHIRSWCTAIARELVNREHLLIAFVVAPGDTSKARLHAHGVISFPPHVLPPGARDCASAWHAIDGAGEATVAAFNPKLDGLRYMLEHGAFNLQVGCPQRSTCKNGCIEAPTPWIPSRVSVACGRSTPIGVDWPSRSGGQ